MEHVRCYDLWGHVVGSVFLVRAKSDGQVYALKQIRVNRDDITGNIKAVQ